MQLLRSQLNELFEYIEKAKFFSHTQFEVFPATGEVNFKGTLFYFRIFEDTGYANSLVVNFSPGKTLYKDASSGIPWEQVKVYFINWLTYLKREISAPDKWDQMKDEINYLIGDIQVAQTEFSHGEYLQVQANIEMIKSSLSTIPLLHDQQIAIMNQLGHVANMTEKMNKFDWRNFFVGTMMSCIIQLGVSRENAALLIELIRRSFNGLFIP